MASGADKTVLVVEDDPGVLGVLRIALARAGFTVLEASTGTDALRLIEELSPDGVVLDLMLPDDRSSAVLDVLRAKDGTGPAWVAISALDRSEVRARYGDIDPWFLAKPFDPWDLANRLNRALRQPGG